MYIPTVKRYPTQYDDSKDSSKAAVLARVRIVVARVGKRASNTKVYSRKLVPLIFDLILVMLM